MDRVSFIKNICGGIIGYALLPKVLTELIPFHIVERGIWEKASKIEFKKGCFKEGDIIQSLNGRQYYMTRDKQNRLLGKSLNIAEVSWLGIIEI